jgi:hypothetical protein
MPIVKYSLGDGKELTPEEEEAARLRIQEAARRPYVYDPDSPLLTEKQLSEFRPVNFDSMEERARAMEAAGIIDPEKAPTLAMAK